MMLLSISTKVYEQVQDAGHARPLRAGSDSTHLSSRDLYGTMRGRLLTAASAYGHLARRWAEKRDVQMARFWATEAAHFYNRAQTLL